MKPHTTYLINDITYWFAVKEHVGAAPEFRFCAMSLCQGTGEEQSHIHSRHATREEAETALKDLVDTFKLIHPAGMRMTMKN